MLVVLLVPLVQVGIYADQGPPPNEQARMDPYFPKATEPRSPVQSPVWITETVDSAGDVGLYNSIALDGENRPHISYSAAGDDLKYAYYDGVAWHGESVAQGWSSSLKLDRQGHPHIGYATGHSANYVWHDGAAWHVETVEEEPDPYYGYMQTSLALDAADRPHMAFVRCRPLICSLRYAYSDGSAWHSEEVAIGGGQESGSLALNTESRPYISYYDDHGYTADLKLAHREGDAWITETVDPAENAGFGNSLAFDGAGRPHISYLQGISPSYDLKYAWYDGDYWHIETIAAEASGPTALAIDQAGRPHIAYGDALSHTLKYAWYNGTAWRIETVDHLGTDFFSLGLDGTDQPHISYYDSTNGDLKHAYKCVAPSSVRISGPDRLPTGIVGLYTATVAPPTATLPLLAWDNGHIGPTTTYSWTTAGLYTLTVTATNGCGQIHSRFTVTTFCQPPTGARIEGPSVLLVNQAATYQASSLPITASLPLTWVWNSGLVGPTQVYSWTAVGTYTLTVTGTNACGQASASRRVLVLETWPYRFYLPVITRHNE